MGGGVPAAGGGGDTLTYESATMSVETSPATTHTADTTTGIDSGDLIALIGCTDTTGGDITMTCPTGGTWTKTEFGTGTGAAGEGVLCVKANADGTEDGGTLDWGSSSNQPSVSFVLVFNGHDTGTPVTCSAGTDSNGSLDAISTALAVGDSGDIMLRAFCADQGKITTDTGFATECDTNISIQESADGGSGPASGGVCIDASPSASAVTWTGVFADNTVDSTGISCRIED
jgi:hypothetical protein